MTRRPLLKPDGASPREIAFAVNQLLLGRINSHGSITLTADVDTTTLERPYIGPSSVVLLSPLSANAAAALATIWISCASGTATLNHANNSQTDRSFNFIVIGG